MKRPTKKDEKRIQSFLRGMEDIFYVQWHDRSLTFSQEANSTFAASIEIEDDYQRIYITIYPLFWEHTLKQQRIFLLHEFCHALTRPLKEVVDNLKNGKLETQEHIRVASEKSTSMITNILDLLLRSQFEHSRKVYADYIK